MMVGSAKPPESTVSAPPLEMTVLLALPPDATSSMTPLLTT
jgi:hypothetical protein